MPMYWMRSNLNVAALKQADGLAVAPRHRRRGSMQVGPSRDAGWPPLGLVSWHGPSGERFAIEHRVSASDVIRQLEATGLSREHPGRAFSEWPTILSERALADASAFQVSRWRGGRYGCAKVGHACVPGSPRFGTMPKRA